MRDKRHNVDMINGPLFSRMVIYTVPLMLTSFLQLFYNAADVAVVGKFAGPQALAAVGSNTSLINLLVNLFLGISLGVRVMVSQYYGAKNHTAIQQTIIYHYSYLMLFCDAKNFIQIKIFR